MSQKLSLTNHLQKSVGQSIVFTFDSKSLLNFALLRHQPLLREIIGALIYDFPANILSTVLSFGAVLSIATLVSVFVI